MTIRDTQHQGGQGNAKIRRTLPVIAAVPIALAVVATLAIGCLVATQPAAVQARPSDGLPTAVIEYSNVAPVFGVILEKNLRVVAVEPNSAAQRAGIQAGDVITTVGRSAVTSSAGAKQAFRQSVTKSGQSISVTVTRNGKAVISAPVVAHSPVRSLKGPTPTPVPTNLDYF